jgi:signal transduction histidine kinase
MTLQWKVFSTNAGILIAATLVLVLTPLTVSFPVALAELVALAGGLLAMLALNLVLLRRVFGPLSRLATVMRGIDPLRPRERAAIEAADPEVAELTAAFNGMLDRLEDERRDSARRALAAQERERQRIARELHDSTAQHLAAVGLNLMRLKLAAGASADAERICSEMKSALREAQKELRVFTYLLHPPELDSEGLKTTVERFAEGVSQRTGLRIRVRISPAVDDAAFEIQRAVFRVLQEALTNVHRHAKASRVLVLLNVDAGLLSLFVKDDGRGLPATNGSPDANRATLGVGIPGMEARMRRFGGELSVRRASRGTVVRATVPMRENAPGAVAEDLAPDRLDLGVSPAAGVATVH